MPQRELKRLGPRAAQESLCKTFGGPADRQRLLKSAKTNAILGSMSLSLDSFMSGIRCYFAFVGRYSACAHNFVINTSCVKGHVFAEAQCYLPPTLDMLLAWSTMFRSAGTFHNYLGYVKTGCMLEGASTEVMPCLFYQ